MRKLTPEEHAEREAYFLWNPPAEGRIDLHAPFVNGNPLHIEIGSGRGEFLAARARQLPQVNFLGFEGNPKRMPLIMRQLLPGTHSNVRITRLYLDDDTVKRMPPASVECVYILHPDPWPKRRHFPRRLVQRSFLDVLSWLLKPGGEVLVSTDHQEYAQWIQRVFAEHESYEALPYELDPERHIVTHFEAKKQKEGFEPVRMRYRRKAGGGKETP